jgi:2Fe-2S ferredoxin
MALPEITFMPDNKKVQVRIGTTLLDAGRRARVNIRTRCGGKAACMMCKVQVKGQEGLAPMNVNEQLKLGEQASQGYRLACQARIQGDVCVTLPEDPLKAAVRVQLLKQQEEDW